MDYHHDMNRELTFTEKLYLTGESIAPPFALQIVVEGEGEVSLEALTRAVRKGSDTCSGVKRSFRSGKWIDSEHYPPVSERDPKEWDRSLNESLDPRAGKTAEVVLFRDKPEGLKLLFRVLHSVMDGKGALIWVEQIFRSLREEELIAMGPELTEADVLKKSSTIHKQKKLINSFRPLIDLSGAQRDSSQFIRRTLVGHHPALVAKLCAHLAAASLDEDSLFMIPVDLRRHDESIVSTSNLSLPIFLENKRGDSWESIHENLLKALRLNLDISQNDLEKIVAYIPKKFLQAALRAVLKLQHLTQKFPVTALISHIGQVHLPAFSCSGLQAKTLYSIPVHIPLFPLCFVAVDCVEHTELLVSTFGGASVRAELESLVNSIEKLFLDENLMTWTGNQTQVTFESDINFIDLFSKQVIKTPGAPALVSRGEVITYKQLDERSTSLAYELKLQGISAGDVVTVLLDRTPLFMYTVLGILKTGAAFLPIDSEYSDERITYLLKDSGSKITVTQKAYLDRLGDSHVLDLESVDLKSMRDFSEFVPGKSSSAYIIYTSGSTGLPKGVRVGHKSLTNYLKWAKNYYHVESESQFAFFTSSAFDLSITSYLLPLISGGSVVLFPDHLDHFLLREILTLGKVNSLKLTPTHLELISRLGIRPAHFKIIIVGGEQFKASTALLTRELFGSHCRIINEYGPTEATVGCVVHEFDEKTDLTVVPIGVPISNTEIYLLNFEGKHAVLDEIGEIYIVGESLALEYLNSPDLTQGKFASIEVSENRFLRAYRTGDLASFNDGLLHYVGRIDEQVKIKGRRIELGELESVLEELPEISKAIASMQQLPQRQEKVLCVHVVTDDDLDEALVKNYLSKKLPFYMVPVILEKIEEVPLTVNGKIDTSALKVSRKELVSQIQIQDFDELEEKLRNIWADVLKVPVFQINLDSGFYELGGDSLKLIELLSSLSEQVIGKENEQAFMAEIRTIIHTPTFRKISQVTRRFL